MRIFFDNASTTRVLDCVIDDISDSMRNSYGNPSSLHFMGMESEKILRSTRELILEILGDFSGSVYFTSGGTESNNLAIQSLNLKSVKNVVTTSIEHASVRNCIKKLENSGVNVRYLNPSSNFDFSKENINNLIDEKTDFISAMHVNNEVGVILPLSYIAEVRNKKCPNAIFHVDAVQGFYKLPINVKELGIDFLSFSAHKIHGPKGVGGLYVSKKANLNPMMFGGNQQNRIRPGTEPVELIRGFKKVLEMRDIDKRYRYVKEINDYCRTKILDIENIVINSPADSSPYILNFSVLGMKSEILLNFLSENGICVSSSSACTGNSRSHVLISANLPENRIDSAIRVSFSIFNSKDDVDKLVYYIKQAKEILN